MNRKYLKLAALAFVIWYVITRPNDAAAVVNNVVDALAGAADSLSQFVSAL